MVIGWNVVRMWMLLGCLGLPWPTLGYFGLPDTCTFNCFASGCEWVCGPANF